MMPHSSRPEANPSGSSASSKSSKNCSKSGLPPMPNPRSGRRLRDLMIRLGRLVGPEVQALEPLLAAYFAAVPEDPWADVPQDALAWYQILSESPGGLVLVAVAEDRLIGFCVAEVVIDEPNRTRCMMVYAAYVAP